MPLVELAEWCGLNAEPGSPAGEVAKAILNARLQQEHTHATQEGSERLARLAQEGTRATEQGTQRLVRATWWLVFGTWVLAATTVVVALLR